MAGFLVQQVLDSKDQGLSLGSISFGFLPSPAVSGLEGFCATGALIRMASQDLCACTCGPLTADHWCLPDKTDSISCSLSDCQLQVLHGSESPSCFPVAPVTCVSGPHLHPSLARICSVLSCGG